MAMFFNSEDRPDQGIIAKLAVNNTPLTKIPFPKNFTEPYINYQELLASERYKQVIENVRKYTDITDVYKGMNRNMQISLNEMMDAYQRVATIESFHIPELEKLAVKIVLNEMGIPEGAIEIDAKIIQYGQIDTNDFNKENISELDNNPVEVNIDDNTPEIPREFDEEELNLERAKRRLINAIIQGASKRGHYMYHLAYDELMEIFGSEYLMKYYGIMMSINDLNYWQMSDNMIGGLSNSVAGKCEVQRPSENEEESEEEPTAKIIVRGITFPVLLHELIKGIMELFSHQGEPNDKELFIEVMKFEDTLEKEMWDLRLGAPIWDKIRSQFPDDLMEEENKELQNYLLVDLFKLPAKEFLMVMREILSESDKGKKLLNDMLNIINKRLREEDYEDIISKFQKDVDGLDDDE